jgi:hypothetical protein
MPVLVLRCSQLHEGYLDRGMDGSWNAGLALTRPALDGRESTTS